MKESSVDGRYFFQCENPAEQLSTEVTVFMRQRGAHPHYSVVDKIGNQIVDTLYAHTHRGYDTAVTMAQEQGGYVVFIGRSTFKDRYGIFRQHEHLSNEAYEMDIKVL